MSQTIDSPALINPHFKKLMVVTQGVLMPQMTRYPLVGNPNHKKKNAKDRRTGIKLVDQLGKIKQNRLMLLFLQKLKAQISLNYRSNYNFCEQWERNGQDYQQSKTHQSQFLLFDQSSVGFLVIQVILIVAYMTIFWISSIQIAFELKIGSFFPSSTLFLTATVVDMLKDLSKNIVVDNQIYDSRKQIAIFYLKNQFSVDAISLICAIIPLSVESVVLIRICEGIICFISIIKFRRKYYDHIKDRLFSNQSIEKFMNLLELFALMLISSHLFGLLLYCAGNLEIKSTQNWIQSIGISEEEWSVKYLYSIYWATTMMVTVGFGDITPKNKYQVIVTMIIEFLGAALFGYVINTIGMTMTEIRKASQKLNQELKTVNRHSKCFGLTPDLNFRLKQYIKNSNKAEQTFSMEQEQKMTAKLSPYLNLKILHQTNIRVIKKSVFFISNFTKNFQNKIAMKLKKRLFQPEEPIGPNSKSIFLIDEGLLEIFFCKNINQKPSLKLVKVIKANQKVPLGYNIFGYTALITDCDAKLSAISKSTSKVYELEIGDFKQIICKNPIDLQTFFELRDKMLCQSILEATEAPLLVDPTQHYNPSHYILIKKFLHCPSQIRRVFCRFERQRVEALSSIVKHRQCMRKELERSKMREHSLISSIVIQDAIRTKQQIKDVPNKNNVEIEFAEGMKQYEHYKISNNFSQVVLKYSSVFNSTSELLPQEQALSRLIRQLVQQSRKR